MRGRPEPSGSLCELFHKIGRAAATARTAPLPGAPLHASSPAETDSYRAVAFDDHWDCAASFAEAQHLLELRRVFFDVHVLERDSAPLVVVARRLRIRARVLAVDHD